MHRADRRRGRLSATERAAQQAVRSAKKESRPKPRQLTDRTGGSNANCEHGNGGRWISRRLIYDPSEWQIEEDEAISRLKTEELDRLVAAGTIREVDCGRMRFIVRRIVQPPARPD